MRGGVGMIPPSKRCDEMELKEYVATIRIHEDFHVKVSAVDEDDAWLQATHHVQDIRYHNARVGNCFVLTQVSLEADE